MLAAVLLFIFVLVFGILGLNKELYEIGFLRAEAQEPEILELLHIESFEGGSGSRAEYLRKIARDFNKQNPSKFINVKTMTIEQLELNADFLPDMVSFSVGAGEILKDRLLPAELNFNVRDDLLQYGKIEGEMLAVPYMLGGYAIISRSDYLNKTQQDNIFEQGFVLGKRQVLGVGMGLDGFINPAQALTTKSITGIGQYMSGTTYEVYEGFLKGNFTNLVGTQRDVYRIKNRENNGIFVSCEYEYLGGFSDLVQYLGLMKESAIAQEFIKFVLSKQSQSVLSNIGMFSVNGDIYSEGYMKAFEKVLAGPLTSVNVFLTKTEIEQAKAASIAQVGASAYEP
ncbi:MAG: hypothetical protein LBN07_04280 [Christensenellaceae bacterium]|nr:hypothetical protein [Christensenellaceae bacterium]